MADPTDASKVPNYPPKGAPSDKGNIPKIKQALTDIGLTTSIAQSAILGILGVESHWQPVAEGCKYRDSVLRQYFRKGASEADYQKYANWTGDRNEFFGWVYGTRLGLKASDGLYYGRGLVQLTGKGNYAKFTKLLKSQYGLNIDLVKDPDLLLDFDTSVKVCALYFTSNINNWKELMYTSDFVHKAMQCVNPGETDKTNNYKLKLKYYEYFMGGVSAPPPPPSSDKDVSSSSPKKTAKEIAAAPEHKKEAYSEDRSENLDKNGFSDPNGQYPLRDYMNEADTNRLARSVVKGTHIDFKDNRRKKHIPIANEACGGEYDQPYSVYNSSYPYNKVTETESGHVMEFDDSPGGERINIYHRQGTFTEIDPEGTQVNFIVGDGYYITEKNGNVYIQGTCNVTTGSSCNIYVQGNANIEVDGTSDITLHNDTNIGVATDLNLVVGGNFNLKVDNNFNVQVGNTVSVRSNNLVSLESNKELTLKSARGVSMQGGNGMQGSDGQDNTSNVALKLNGDFAIETDGNYSIKAKSFKLDAKEGIDIHGTTIKLNDPSFTPLEPLGTKQKVTNFDGSNTDIEEYTLVDTYLNPAETAIKQIISAETNLPVEVLSVDNANPTKSKVFGANMTAPEARNVSHNDVPNLIPGDRKFDSAAKYESEDDMSDTQRAKDAKARSTDPEYQLAKQTKAVNPDTGKADSGEAVPQTESKVDAKSIDQDKLDKINNTGSFNSSYKLSEHFTLGMLMGPGVVLKDTNLPAGKSGSTGGKYTKQDLVANLTALCENILEPIYAKYGPPCGQIGPRNTNGIWSINSGLRNDTNGSDHNKGMAVDIGRVPKLPRDQMLDWAKELEAMLPYHQFLLEYRNPGAPNNGTGAWQNWCHISYNMKGNQHHKYTYLNDKKVKDGAFVLL